MFTDTFNNTAKENRSIIEAKHSEDLIIIRDNYNAQMELLKLYLLVIKSDPYVDADEYSSMVFTAIFKNFLSLYSALDLTLQGFYGGGRILFRNIYEFLIISKTIAIKNDIGLLRKWENGESISLRTEVFREVRKPNSEEMKNLWRDLCSFTHGTIYSQQIDISYITVKNEIKLNFIYIKMLLDMNYHLLNRHAVNPSIQYYAKRMSDLHEMDILKNKKNEIQTQIKTIRETLLKEPKRVVLDFASKWEFR